MNNKIKTDIRCTHEPSSSYTCVVLFKMELLINSRLIAEFPSNVVLTPKDCRLRKTKKNLQSNGIDR